MCPHAPIGGKCTSILGTSLKEQADYGGIRIEVQQHVERMEGGELIGARIENLHVHQQAPQDPERRGLLILLSKVREFWVEGVLQRSVHGEALIDLKKETDTEAVEHPWERVVDVSGGGARVLPPEMPMADVFETHGRALLILGEPGAGKTMTLLELARVLLDQAEQDPLQPIPVVFNLSSWADPKRPLGDWMIQELNKKYQVSEKVGCRWLRTQWLLPLFDGLDEVRAEHRAACVEAINTFVEEYGVPGLAVCSRLSDYAALRPVRLRLNGAIRLQPLDPAQVEAYVARSGAALAGLSAALAEDPVLREMAETPLMLDVMTVAYRDAPAEALASGGLDTPEARRHHLFEAYIDRMFRHKGRGKEAYSREQVLVWLTWLARGMQAHSQTVFLIEQLQPSWLPSRYQRWTYILASRLLTGAGIALITGFAIGLPVMLTGGGEVPGMLKVLLSFGLSFGLAGGIVDIGRLQWRNSHAKNGLGDLWMNISLFILVIIASTVVIEFIVISSYEVDPLYGQSEGPKNFGILIGVYEWLGRHTMVVVGLLGGVAGTVFWMLRNSGHSLLKEVVIVYSVGWSWAGAQKSGLKGVRLVTLVILSVGMLAVAVYYRGRSWGQVVDALFLLTLLVMYWSMIGGLYGALKGGVRFQIKPGPTYPNQGLHKTAWYAAVAGGTAWLLSSGLYVLVMVQMLGDEMPFVDTTDTGADIGVALGVGVFLGWAVFLWFGGANVLLHYTLRFVLGWLGYMPWKLAPLLEYVTHLIYMRQVGGGYIFIHRLLLEYFATMGDAPRAPAVTSAPRAKV